MIKLQKIKAGYYTATLKYLADVEILKWGDRWKLEGVDNKHEKHFEYFFTLKAVKQFLQTFDMYFEQMLERQAKGKKIMANLDHRVTKFINTHEDYHVLPKGSECDMAKNLKVGDLTDILYGWGKDGSLGELLYNIFYAHTYAVLHDRIIKRYKLDNFLYGRDCYKDDQLRISKAKIEKIVTLTQEQFDELTNGFLSAERDVYGFGYGGHNPQRKFDLVTLVTAPNRKSIFVNCEGYSYARYAAIPVYDIRGRR